ncbi:MAG: hypothetical protein KatS3mg105_4407 [Gemmatales bacterium]|nr:MAG: hypothetical protein KatS3mg105_3289 [Gemmatales bacterium]GIW82600.1 MAG: hypothetical protein KatS3mg105_4407 [Gemmatales bacterium]
MHAANERLAVRSREAAVMLGISTRTLFTLTKNNKIPHIRLGDGERRAVLYPVEALREWLRKESQQQPVVD